MEQNSQVEILEDQIRECFGRVVWTHKTHEKCADILHQRFSRIRNWQIILSAITMSGVLYSVFGYNQIIAIITAIISTTLFALNMYARSRNYGSSAEKHSFAAKELWNIRENYFSLLTDIRNKTLTPNQIIKLRDSLQKDLYSIYKGSNRTFFQAYKLASEALKRNEELTFSDEEIDKFLPKRLKRN